MHCCCCLIWLLSYLASVLIVSMILPSIRVTSFFLLFFFFPMRPECEKDDLFWIGSARTSLIITIGPSARHHAETTSTIMFGQRVTPHSLSFPQICMTQEMSVQQLLMTLPEKIARCIMWYLCHSIRFISWKISWCKLSRTSNLYPCPLKSVNNKMLYSVGWNRR